MKNIYKKVIFVLTVFMIGIGSVYAKNAELTCTYNWDLSTTSTESKTDFVKYTCVFYDDNTQDCVATKSNGKTNNDNMVNSSKVNEWYAKNKTCTPYVVFIDTQALTGIEFYGYSSMSEAEAWAQDRKRFYDNVYTSAPSSQVKADGTEIGNPSADEQAKKDYEDKLNYAKNFASIGGIDKDCEMVNGVWVYKRTGYSQQLCIDAINAAKSTLASDEKKIIKLYQEGKITKSEYDAYASQFKASINQLGDPSKDWNEDLKKMEEKIDNGSKKKTDNSEYDDANCPIDPNSNTYKDLIGALNIMKIAGPLLVVGFTIFEFIKATASGDSQSELKKLTKRLIKRMIYCVLLFAIPILVEAVLKVTEIIPENGCSFTQADIDK